MSYQALYRVWRPQKFSDIVGQEAVTRTLRNALIQKKPSHAYLFTGPRGTGKTSAAKIFAKAINCPYQQDGEPCNDCEICQAITEGRLNDVIEIDAASNNGVEEIRDIRDKARYAPTQAEYKIYIIDEVHMLSTGAFNALLKTLEEPPEKVIFILATTEPHKIPLTIISRTQRFDFKRMTYQNILERMQYILKQEGVTYEIEALQVVARAANGGMRDALSLLDQVIAYDSHHVAFEHAVQVSGSLTEEMVLAYAEALQQQQPEKALGVLASIIAEGKEAGRFVEELILFVRDLLVEKQTDRSAHQTSLQATDRFRKFAEKISASFLYQLMEELNETQKEMRLSTQPEVYLEVLTVKMAQQKQPERLSKGENHQNEPAAAEIHQLEKEVAALKKELAGILADLKNGKLQSPAAESIEKDSPRAISNKQAVGSGKVFKANTALAQKIMREASRKELSTLQECWGDILDCLSVTQRAVLRQAQPVAASETACILSFDYEILSQKAAEDEELQRALGEAVQRIAQRPGEAVFMTTEQWTLLRKNYVQSLKNGKPVQSSEMDAAIPTGTAHSAADSNRGKSEETVFSETYLDDADIPPETASYFALESSEAEQEEQRQEEVVEQAVSLFGEEIITVIPD